MKIYRHIILFVIFAIISNNTQAQKLLSKVMKESSEFYSKKDGFIYKWYIYKYLEGKDTIYELRDINGEIITPKNDVIDKRSVPLYIGGLVFQFYTRKMDSRGHSVVIGVNTQGKCVFPETIRAWQIFYNEDGLFTFLINNDYGKEIQSVYNYKGECLIPTTNEYTTIMYFKEYKCWCCSNDKIKHIYTLDGRYYAEGDTYSYNLSTIEGQEKFNKNKKRTSYPSTLQQPQTPSPTPQPQPQPKRDPVPMQVWKQCLGCGGSGQCQTCYGQGWRYLTSSQPHAQCITCGGNGRCNMCAGQGGHYEVEYK